MKVFILKTLALTILCFHFSLFSEEDAEAEYYRQEEARKHAYAEYIGYVNEIRSAVAEEVKKELGLRCSGTKGMMHEKIEDLGMDLVAYRRASVQEARALLLQIIDQFVKAVNTHEKIQPFLEVSPFTYERAHVFITFMRKNQGYFSDGSVSYVFNITGNANAEENRNKLFYYSHDPFTSLSNDILEETYEEAVALNSLDPVSHPEVHQGNIKEELFDQFFGSFVKDVKNELGLHCKEIGGQLADDIETISGNFVMFQPVNQDQARQLLVSATEMLLKGIREQKELEPYYREQPFPSKRIKMRISFRTRKDRYFYETSIKDVILENDTISYDKAVKGSDGLTDFIPVGTETYSEAFERVKNSPVSISNFWLTLSSFFNFIN